MVREDQRSIALPNEVWRGINSFGRAELPLARGSGGVGGVRYDSPPNPHASFLLSAEVETVLAAMKVPSKLAGAQVAAESAVAGFPAGLPVEVAAGNAAATVVAEEATATAAVAD